MPFSEAILDSDKGLSAEKIQINATKEALSRGEIPSLLREEWELLDENSPTGQAFQSYMFDLVQKFLIDAGEIEKANSLNMRFFLTNSSHPNAGIVASSEPKIMMFSKGFWEKVKSQDQLEAVIGHELGHGELHNEIGEHANSKGEEAGADLYGTELLRRAGRNVEALREFLLSIHEVRESAPMSWHEYVDVHPSTALRVRLLGNAYEAIREKYGDYQINDTALPETVIMQFSDISDEYVDLAKSAFKEYGFPDGSNEENAEWLIKNIDLYAQLNEEKYSRRSRIFAELYSNTARSLYRDPAFRDKDNKVTGKGSLLLETMGKAAYDTNEKMHYQALWPAHEIGYYPAHLAMLQAAVSLFINSPASYAEEWAEIIKKNAEASNYDSNPCVGSPKYDSFIAPSKNIVAELSERTFDAFLALKEDESVEKLYDEYGIEMLWEGHVRAYLETGSENILFALRLLGIEDPRLPRLTIEEHDKVVKYSLSRPQTEEDTSFDFGENPKVSNDGKWLFFDPDVELHGDWDKARKVFEIKRDGVYTGDYDREKVLRYEKYYSDRNDLKQESYLKEIDFSEMKHDFWGFVASHRDALIPIMSAVEGKNPLHDKFIKELQKLIAEDPDVFRPIAFEFFSGRDVNTRTPIINDSKRLTLIALFDDASLSQEYPSFNKGDDFFCGEAVGVRFDHPYIKFLIDDPEGLLADKQLAMPLLQYTPYKKKRFLEKGDVLEDILDSRMLLQEPQWDKNSIFQLGEWTSNIEEQYAELASQEGFNEELAEGHAYFSKPNLEGLDEIDMFDFFVKSMLSHKYLQTTNDDLSAEELEKISNILNENGGTLKSIEIAITAYIENNFHRTLEKPIEDLCHTYNYYMDEKFLKFLPEIKQAFRITIAERIDEFKDLQQKLEFIEYTLKNHSSNPPAFKDRLLKVWIETQVKIAEQAPDYSVLDVADRLISEMPLTSAYAMVSGLADQLLCDRETSYELESRLNKAGLKSLPQQHLKGVFGEVFLDRLGFNPELRSTLIDYLCGEETPEKTKAMAVVIERDAERFYEDTLKTDKDNYFQLEKVSQQEKEEVVRLMHENYSSWPLEIQALFLDKALFPVNAPGGDDLRSLFESIKETQAKPINIETEMEIIFDRAFPIEKKGSDMARDYLKSHLEQLSDDGKRLYLAVIMASAKEKEADIDGSISEMREIGRTLGRILGKMHPIGVKLVQELESFAGTDEELRQGLRDIDVKSSVDLPTRWGLWHIIDDALEERQDIIQDNSLGAVLGGGGIQIAVCLTHKKTGEKSALTLLRPDIAKRGLRQKRIFGGALEGFLKKWPNFSEVNALLNASYQNLKDEINYALAPKQSLNMKAVYENGRITSDGIQVNFDAVGLKAYGAKFKHYSMAEGVHFNDLPVTTKQEVETKRAIAKAIITRELSAMLSGQAIDSDRHGKQQKVVISNENQRIIAHVNNFDDGAMALEPPTIEERKALGKLIGIIAKRCLVDGVEVSDAMNEATEAFRDKEHSHYIETSKRALRTMFGDYMNAQFEDENGIKKTLISKDDVKDVFSAILRKGDIHHNVLFSAAREIGYSGFKKIRPSSLVKATAGIVQRAFSQASVNHRLGRSVEIEDERKLSIVNSNSMRLFLLEKLKAKVAKFAATSVGPHI